MAEGDYSSHNIYTGSDYGFDPGWGKEYGTGVKPQYAPKAGQIGFSTDATTANQLNAVSKSLNTGAKNIEVSGLNITGGGPGGMLDKIPKQHLKEIERLKKLTGSELTFHGPLLEPTGITKQGWEESHRQFAETQMYDAVKRAQVLEPKGNLVVTFHSSVIPFEDVKIKNEDGQEQIVEVGVTNTAEGRFMSLPVKPDYFHGDENVVGNIKEQKKKINEMLEKQNKESWFKKLFGVTYHANQGTHYVQEIVRGKMAGEEGVSEPQEKWKLELYKQFLQQGDFQKVLAKVPDESVRNEIGKEMEALVHGDSYLRDAYQDLQNLFNEAYKTAKENNKKDDIAKLEGFRNEIKGQLKGIEDPEKLADFGKIILKGASVLRSVDVPQEFVPYRDFAIDKSSDTFSNVAFKSYKKFKENAPIISIENPPAGTAALDRAEDLRDLVKKTREKLTNKFVSEMGMSKSDAEREAEKLVGVTWDVGHINMIRKYGYEEKDVVEQAKIVAPYVKHVHLSDNFGMEHTELPMGMGNVPIAKILELKKGFEKAKKVVEVGDWWSRQGGLAMTHSPMRETLRAFGSPIYAMQMTPAWSRAGAQGNYFAGFGGYLPERYFSTYGSSFANLPSELGGQTGGRNRLGGAPVE